MEMDKNMEFDQEQITSNEEDNQQQVEITMEQLEEMLQAPLIEMDLENVADIELDKSQYEKGVKLASYYCGIVNALKNFNVKISAEDVISLILNDANVDHNIKIADKNNKTSIEISKNQTVQIEKTQL